MRATRSAARPADFGFAVFAREFDAALPASPSVSLGALSGPAAAYAALAMARPGRAVFAVAPGLPEADVLFADAIAVCGEAGVRVLEYPPELEDDPAAAAARIRTAAALGAWAVRPYPLVVAVSVPALESPPPDPAAIARGTLSFRQGAEFPGGTAAAAEALAKSGYARANDVRSPMQFAVRGGILDVWPAGDALPVRVEFFGDDAESLRLFDPSTQGSVKTVEAAEVPPGTARASRAPGGVFAAVPAERAAALWLDHNAYRRPDGVPPLALEVYSGDPAPRGVPSGAFLTSPLPGLSEARGEVMRNPGLLDAVRSRLERHLESLRSRGGEVFEAEALSAGFEIPGKAAWVAKSDRTLARGAARRRRAAAPAGAAEGAADLEPGELVVHADHGIGRFKGTTEIELDGKRSEVLAVEYADGAKLYVPASQAHVLTRYVGVKGEKARLHPLGGRRWEKEKAAAGKSVRNLAATLIEIQARRAVSGGFVYDVSPPGYADFEATFPYVETEDQAKAFADVERDMASPRTMDRLVCGDAGYGKTEVAMRAACIAALNGRQTAVLAPTTVLAQQHFETFSARFDGLPVRVEALSRFQSPAARKGALERLAAGSLDIAIGTHALLSKRVKFKDLGLIVIDEEQRFGVAHKEMLKRLSPGADVLTLSATPIPRTLHMAMTGVRDLSLLRTPPQERVAVETRIVRDTDETVARALEAELARGGQAFFLHNRVATIAFVRDRLAALCPGARIDVAHGQMDGRELAERMDAFARGRTDILLCTSIVESGLDIPRANTIIVDRADRFGLAELYQLRGRVGRGARRGHAYFLLPPEGQIDSEARERMDALRRHSGLGAGFGLALRDLEIRGAGNILGREQSGHIAAVGFELYCQLLRRAVAALKGEKAARTAEAELDLDFADLSPGGGDEGLSMCLPYSYVEEEVHRAELHRRLAEAATAADVRAVRRSAADRFGPPPKPALRLFRAAELRVRCSRDGFTLLETKDGRARFYRDGSRVPSFSAAFRGKDCDAMLSALFTLEARAAARARNAPAADASSSTLPTGRTGTGSDFANDRP